MSPIRLCIERTCGNVATIRGRCATHATENRRFTRSPNDAFYSSKAWQMSRRAQLFARPLCEFKLEDGSECGVIADSVHHVVPIEDGGPRRDPSNLMSTCRPHHSHIHALMRLDKR